MKNLHSVSSSTSAPLTTKHAIILCVLAAASFHAAFAHPLAPALVGIYLACLVELTRLKNGRRAFYTGIALGLGIFAPKLTFFYTIFGPAALPLWCVLAFWHGLFLLLGSWARHRFSPWIALLLIPTFWTGLEFFRSELYPLKFSWMSAGYAFAHQPNILLSTLGLYGVGFILMLAATLLTLFAGRRRLLASLVTFLILFALTFTSPLPNTAKTNSVNIAGTQLEFPVELEIPSHLDRLKKKHPDAQLFVLSEYTFDGPVPIQVKRWCRQNSSYLIVGGKEPVGSNFYNTAFVIGPDGEIVFKQVKAVPIQFFKDGLPAPEQRVWNSPWGKIGICVCYDLSYTKVVDELVRQGAELLVVPTMDVEDWGQTQHQLHSLIAPTRAAEYSVPIFRLASSGISQVVSAQGIVQSTAPFPGQGTTLFGKISVSNKASLPPDRLIARVCSAISLAALFFSLVDRRLRRPTAPSHLETNKNKKGERRSLLLHLQNFLFRSGYFISNICRARLIERFNAR